MQISPKIKTGAKAPYNFVQFTANISHATLDCDIQR